MAGNRPVSASALEAWVSGALGSDPVAEIFSARHQSAVAGYRLSDGREVVVKVRPGLERAASCVAAQAALFEDGFPCPEPLTPVAELAGLAVHAEAYVQGEERLQGTDGHTVDRFARVLADLQGRLERLDPDPPCGRPMWLAWDHLEAGVWPEAGVDYPAGGVAEIPAWLTALARRVRQRMRSVDLPEVVGHADWETQHLRWNGDRLLVVHDWDSLSPCSEAALADAAAATFPSDRQPVLAPLPASERFLATYQAARGRSFTHQETEVAWGAGLWLAAHNARMEVIYGKRPLVLDRLELEGDQRLLRAGA